jgi:hypothetical protein
MINVRYKKEYLLNKMFSTKAQQPLIFKESGAPDTIRIQHTQTKDWNDWDLTQVSDLLVSRKWNLTKTKSTDKCIKDKYPTIYILNGPPNCGKDTIGDMLRTKHNWLVSQFKHDLYLETAKYYQVDVNWLKPMATNRIAKEIKSETLLGLTPRQALIHVSENICKPMFGQQYFGELAAKRVQDVSEILKEQNDQPTVFTDGGFVAEAEELAKIRNVVVLQLHGRGTFQGDSRNFIEPKRGCKTYKLVLMDGCIKQAVADVMEVHESRHRSST